MPELPDILLYVHALAPRVVGARFEQVTIANPFLLRSTFPPLDAFQGRIVNGVTHIGKRLVLEVEGGLYLVLHLMIAGRLHWHPPSLRAKSRRGLASFAFSTGQLLLTEAGSTRRAWLRAVSGREALDALDPGGLDVLTATPEAFEHALRRETHTLKRALTDPHVFAGIGNAYSDEILHAARLSPFRLTTQLDEADCVRLREACRTVLATWIEALQRECGDRFPEGVTAFRPGMAVHGKFGQPCPTCATRIQRIRYAEHEANYCPTCQTGGRLLADRALSRLLRQDWPRTLDELEARKARLRET